jgi:predicted GH43/DUF377 family glycosyl hydrolase
VVEIPPLERLPHNPLIEPSQIPFARASGAFNPGAVIDRRRGAVVLLVRVFDADTRQSCLALAISSDGMTIDEVRSEPAVVPEAPYESWGVEDARITFLEEDGRYAITYTGYSPDGPRACLMMADDILDTRGYTRHGPRIASENKNCVVFPQKIDGRYVILHRPLPRIMLVTVPALDTPWPQAGNPIVGPRRGTWRSARVGAGAPPLRTRVGWLFPFHGATTIDEGNVYSMGWCVLDADDPTKVRFVSDGPALWPEAAYEIEPGPIPQVDPANFPSGVRVVFPEGMVTRGNDLLVYYGAADVHVGVARVGLQELVDSLERAIAEKSGALPFDTP